MSDYMTIGCYETLELDRSSMVDIDEVLWYLGVIIPSSVLLLLLTVSTLPRSESCWILEFVLFLLRLEESPLLSLRELCRSESKSSFDYEHGVQPILNVWLPLISYYKLYDKYNYFNSLAC